MCEPAVPTAAVAHSSQSSSGQPPKSCAQSADDGSASAWRRVSPRRTLASRDNRAWPLTTGSRWLSRPTTGQSPQGCLTSALQHHAVVASARDIVPGSRFDYCSRPARRRRPSCMSHASVGKLHGGWQVLEGEARTQVPQELLRLRTAGAKCWVCFLPAQSQTTNLTVACSYAWALRAAGERCIDPCYGSLTCDLLGARSHGSLGGEGGAISLGLHGLAVKPDGKRSDWPGRGSWRSAWKATRLGRPRPADQCPGGAAGQAPWADCVRPFASAQGGR